MSSITSRTSLEGFIAGILKSRRPSTQRKDELSMGEWCSKSLCLVPFVLWTFALMQVTILFPCTKICVYIWQPVLVGEHFGPSVVRHLEMGCRMISGTPGQYRPFSNPDGGRCDVPFGWAPIRTGLGRSLSTMFQEG